MVQRTYRKKKKCKKCAHIGIEPTDGFPDQQHTIAVG